MVHSLAQQVIIARYSKGTQKVEAQTSCLEIFLRLKNHQSSLIHERRKFISYDPIYRVLVGIGFKNI